MTKSPEHAWANTFDFLPLYWQQHQTTAPHPRSLKPNHRTRKYSTETAFTTSAIKNLKTFYILTGFQHRLIEQAISCWVTAFSSFFDPSR